MNPLSIAVTVVMVILVVQVIEESRKGFRRKWPLGEISKRVYIIASVVVLAFGILTLVLAILGQPAAVVLAWILAIVMMANGVWLLTQMLVTTGYYPGGYSASFILLAATYLMVVLA